MFQNHKARTTTGSTELTKFIKHMMRQGDDQTNNGAAGGGGAGGDGNKGANSAKTAGEWTVSVPRFKTDAMGNWVFNPWGVTYGKVWEDTRFNANSLVTIPRIIVDNKPAINYRPYDGTLDNVCVGKSTVYNIPGVRSWVKLHRYYSSHRNRSIWMDLRKTLYTRGNGEECHTKDHDTFRMFQECMLRRHQRMEYLIPKYPTHQI
ncbi:uncharacterized protein LOC135436574 isoform X2 [Drosophila montana]